MTKCIHEYWCHVHETIILNVCFQNIHYDFLNVSGALYKCPPEPIVN